MVYRYFLNGTLLEDEAAGWQNKISTIKRDYSIKGIVRLQEGSLTFTGDGYTYLKQQYNSVGHTERVEILIQKSSDYGNNWIQDFKGLIFMAQIEWDDKRNHAKCKLQDDSYSAKIFNNKGLGCNLHGAKSKTGIDITPPPFTDVRLFTPSTATYLTPLGGFDECQAHFAIDVFKYLIAFMTDDEVEFQSTLYDIGGARYKTYLTIGRSLRTYTDGCSNDDFIENLPKLSFQQFIQELDHTENLFFIIERTASGKPIFRLEEYEYFFQEGTVMHSCLNIDELKTKTDMERIYSKVKLGSSITLDDPAMSFPEDINYEGFKLEEYLTIAKDNIDKELDLTRKFIIASNVIEDIIVNNNDAHDKEFVLIEGHDNLAVTYAKATNWIINTGPPVFYNENFRNHAVADKFLKAVPNSIADYLGTGHNEFRAQSTADQTLTNADDLAYTVIQHQNDSTLGNFDVASAYDTGLGRYVVPYSGYYKFQASGQIQFNYTSGSPVAVIAIVITRYTSGMILVSRQTIFYKLRNTILPNPVLTYSGMYATNANINDIIVVEAYSNVSLVTPASPNTWTIVTGGLFFSGFSSTGGGIFKEYNPADYAILQHEFKHKLTEAEFEAIDQDPRGLIEFGIHNKPTRKGWIEKIKFYHALSNADFLLDSNKTINKP